MHTHDARAVLEAAIDDAIALLDALDAPDADLEETGDDEPSLGAYRLGDAYDGEADGSDLEPSLGSLDRQMDQSAWSAGSADDAELDLSDHEHSGGSGASDDEPIFGRPLLDLAAEVDATRQANAWLGGVLLKLAGREMAQAVRS